MEIKCILCGECSRWQPDAKRQEGRRIPMTQNDINKILVAHKKWVKNEKGGRRADFCGDDLSGSDFKDTDLRHANFRGAGLRGADFRGANLLAANFMAADIRGADIDYSCWPLWCGSLDVKIDRRIFCQLAYHLCRVIVDDDDCKEAQLMLGRLANEFHLADECGRVPETPKEEHHEPSL